MTTAGEEFEEWLRLRDSYDVETTIEEGLEYLEELKKKYNVTNSNA